MLPSPAARRSASGAPPDEPPAPRTSAALGLVRQALLGLGIATLVVLLLLFAGSEDRGFIYIDF